MKKYIEPKELFSRKLQNVYACLKNGPCTIEDIISKSYSTGVSFAHPRKDVIKSLRVLRVMGIVKKVSSASRAFELTGSIPDSKMGIYKLSRGVSIILDELDPVFLEISLENIRTKLEDFSDEEFGSVTELLEKSTEVRIKNGKVLKNVTIYTYKKTSD